MSDNKNNRIIHIEFLRILAIILVIFNHTGEYGFGLFKMAEDSLLYGFYMFLAVACKVAVPLFWMVSGALLIPKEEKISELYRKRIFRMVMVLVVFSFIQYLHTVYYKGESYDIIDFFKRLYSYKWATAYWFIYAYLGILVMLPLIRKMVKNMADREFIYLFVIVIVIRGIIPIAEFLVMGTDKGINSKFIDNIMPYAVLYFIVGYYFERRIKESDMSGRKAVVLLLCGFAAIVLTCFVTQYQINLIGKGTQGATQKFYNCLVPIPTFAIYYFVRFIFIRYSVGLKMQKIIVLLGGASFGVMLIENILRTHLKFIYINLQPIIHSLPACIIWVLCVWLVGVAITIVFKKIPVVNKLI